MQCGLWENAILPHFNPPQAPNFFLYLLKTLENKSFSDVFRFCFLMFLGGIERNQLHEMGFRGIVRIALICFRYIF